MMPRVRVLATIETHGERIAAAGASERWALAYGDWVRLYDGTEPAGELPPAPERVYDLRYDGDVLLAAPSRAAGGAWEDLPPLGRSIEPWRVVTATWAGERLLVVQCAPGGGHEQHVRLYNGRTRAPCEVLWADSEWMRVEVVAAGAGRFAAAALEVRVWDESGRDVLTIGERGVQVRRVLLSGEDVIAGYADGQIAVHGRASWKAHADEVRALALHPDGERLVTGGWDGRVALWTLDGELLVETNVGVEVADIAFLGSDRLLALHKLPETGVSLIQL
jgi:WD40 repeat protein